MTAPCNSAHMPKAQGPMNKKVWLEVALNGPWSREKQPGIPLSADEIVWEALACADEGASILHFHAYDEQSGRQRDDYEIYAPIIERIRKSEEHTSELQSLMRISYAVFCLKKKKYRTCQLITQQI